MHATTIFSFTVPNVKEKQERVHGWVWREKCNYIKIPNNTNKPIVRPDYKQILTYVGKNSRAELCLTVSLPLEP